MNTQLIAYYIGILIVLASHAMMLRNVGISPMMRTHAILNIIAVALIAYYFMNTAKTFNPLS